MTDEQKLKIRNLRAEGFGYKKIATMMEISQNTVKTYCQRHNLGGNLAMEKKEENGDKHICKCCGVEVKQNPGRKEKKFCSDACRNKWWNSHLNQVNRKAFYEIECAYCKKVFTVYGTTKRKYCCHECFVMDKFGGKNHE